MHTVFDPALPPTSENLSYGYTALKQGYHYSLVMLFVTIKIGNNPIPSAGDSK